MELTTASGEKMLFDHVILACHTDTTTEILKAGDGMSPEESRILESFKWNRNEAVLHCDERVCLAYLSLHNTRPHHQGIAHAEGSHRLVMLELPD